MALVLLSALVAGALYVSTEELRAGRSDLASERALAAAESAIERTIAAWDARLNTSSRLGASAVVERWFSPVGDRAEVTATRVGRRAVWLTAVATSGADGRTIPARHTIAASLRLVGVDVPLRAALTAGGRVTVRDATVDGRDGVPFDASSMACADETPADVAGLLVPDTLLACNATCSSGPPAGVSGAPPVGVDAGLTSDSTIASGDRALAARATLVLPTGTYAPRPSVIAAGCDSDDQLNWGDPLGGACGDLFRIVRIRGDAVLGAGSVGQGVLLVDGTLRMEAGARFSGVVIASNDVEVTGSGASLTGAAFARDADRVGGSTVADGAEIRYASCAVRRAQLGVSRLVRTPGRWWAELR